MSYAINDFLFPGQVLRVAGKFPSPIIPPMGDDALESITRDTIITPSREQLGLIVEERSINRGQLYTADEAMLVGSGAEVTPITSIDRLPLNDGAPGPISLRIQSAYFEVVHNRVAAYGGGCMPVRGPGRNSRREGAAA